MKTNTTTFIATLVLTCMTAYAAGPAERSTSPNGKSAIEWKCVDGWHKDCEVTAQSPNNQKHSVLSGVPAPKVIWHTNALAEVKVSCGSPCYYSSFYSSEGKVSDPIEFVTAVLAGRKIAIRAGDGILEVVRIFENDMKPLKIIKLDFAPSATIVNVLQEVKFVGDDKLFIRNLAGEDYVEKTTTVSLNIVN